MAVFEFARSVIEDCFGSGAKTVLIGSCALKTYLPGADIDMSVFVPKVENGATDPVAALTSHVCTIMQHQKEEEQVLQKASNTTSKHNSRTYNPYSQSKAPMKFHSVMCVGADTCVIKCVIDNMNVDITFGQENAVTSLELFERFDASYIGQNHILKKSLLLIKAWLLHDASRAAGNTQTSIHSGSGSRHPRNRGAFAPIYGAKDGGLCTYALNTMVTCVLNTHDVSHPLQAFILFFKVS